MSGKQGSGQQNDWWNNPAHGDFAKAEEYLYGPVDDQDADL